MNHLGLRIFRFYIKCTACLSEISFRTDPANTDYVIEAGATRNFEALTKAEKLAEEEQKAYQEELKNNPMKLLEERTEASKNEMDRMEALEELQELNKREVKINYDQMFANYDKFREAEAAKVEAEDEEFVKQVFGKEGGVKIKRILDDDQDDDDEEVVPKPKLPKVDRATDLLAGSSSTVKKQVWEKSVGTLNLKKGVQLVVKKKPAQNGAAETKSTPPSTETKATASSTETKPATSSTETKPTLALASKPAVGSSSTSLGLGLLGDYSDSDDNSDS